MSSSPARIVQNSVVVLHYTLTVGGQVVDSSDEHGPLTVLVGANNIVPGLEAALSSSGLVHLGALILFACRVPSPVALVKPDLVFTRT